MPESAELFTLTNTPYLQTLKSLTMVRHGENIRKIYAAGCVCEKQTPTSVMVGERLLRSKVKVTRSVVLITSHMMIELYQ